MSKAVQDLQKELAALQATAKQQHELEVQTASSIHKLEVVLAGAQSKGAAGENIIENLLASLPVEWQARDFRVGTFTVEFGMRLPNGLVLPIDSKWVASSLLEQLEMAEEPGDLQRVRAQIESAVRARAREVNKYIGSNSTANFGLVVVPDGVFEVCRRAQVDVFSESRVMVISHSLFVPYLLLIYQTALTSAKTIDMEQLDGYLEGTIQRLDQLQSDIVRIDRAIVSLRRTRDRMDGRVSQLRSGVLALQVDTAAAEGPPQLAVVETQAPLEVAREA
jgi:DNA recombination protein RmuC